MQWTFTDGLRVIFGRGPALGPAAKQARAADVLRILGPGLCAIRWGQQIHGRIIASVAAELGHPLTGAACVGRCDGLITSDRGVGVMVWSADCVPVLMAGGNVVAAVHAGWRGAAADIVGAAMNRFRVEYGIPADQVSAWLGPAISGPAYMVGSEVVDALAEVESTDLSWLAGDRVDLRVFLSIRLTSLGLRSEGVSMIGPCTASTPDLASYRRDGDRAGRQWSMIYLAAKHPRN